MPITFTRSYQASDGKCYATLEEAQTVEIQSLLEASDPGGPDCDDHYAMLIVKKKEEILNILTTTDKSRPMARKANGGTKKRTPKPTVVPGPDKAQTLPLT